MRTRTPPRDASAAIQASNGRGRHRSSEAAEGQRTVQVEAAKKTAPKSTARNAAPNTRKAVPKPKV
jgi:hypothetical protein